MLKAFLGRVCTRCCGPFVFLFLAGNTVWAFFITGGPVPREQLPLPVPLEDVCYVSPGRGIFITNAARRHVTDAAPLRVWSLRTGKELTSLQGVCGSDICLAESPNGRSLYTCGRFYAPTVGLNGLPTGTYHRLDNLSQWDLDSGRILRSFKVDHELPYQGTLFASPGGERLFFSGYEELREWDVKTGELVEADPELVPLPLANRVQYFFDEQSSRLRCVIDAKNQYEIRDAEAHSLEQIIAWPEQYVCFDRPFTVTSDGKILLTTDGDGTVRGWSLDNGKMMEHYSAPCRPSTLATSPGGRYLIVDQKDDGPLPKLVRPYSPKVAHTLERIIPSDAELLLIDRKTNTVFSGFPSLRNTNDRIASTLLDHRPYVSCRLYGFLDNEQTLAMLTPDGILQWDLPPRRQSFNSSAWVWLAATVGFSLFLKKGTQLFSRKLGPLYRILRPPAATTPNSFQRPRVAR